MLENLSFKSLIDILERFHQSAEDDNRCLKLIISY